MRLITKFERINTSGYSGERIRPELFLHGPGLWPSDATPDAVWASRGKLVDAREPENADAHYTLRASLRMLAHDDAMAVVQLAGLGQGQLARGSLQQPDAQPVLELGDPARQA